MSRRNAALNLGQAAPVFAAISQPVGVGARSSLSGNPDTIAEGRRSAVAAGRKDGNPRPAAGRVQHRINEAADSLPGQRNNLPPGTLDRIPPEPQADENRDPPANAPTIPT